MSPYQIITRSGRFDPHAYRSYPRRVSKPQMGGFTVDNLRQVRQPGLRLKGKLLPIRELETEGQIYPRPIHFPWFIACWMWKRWATAPGTMRLVEQSFPTRRSMSFWNILNWVVGISTRVRISSSFISRVIDCSCLHVQDTPQDLLNSGPVPLSC